MTDIANAIPVTDTRRSDLVWTEVGPGLWVAKCGADFAGLIEKLWGAGYRATDRAGRRGGRIRQPVQRSAARPGSRFRASSSTSGVLIYDVVRGLVGSEPAPARLAQAIGVRPLGELDFPHELGGHPVHAPGVRRRHIMERGTSCARSSVSFDSQGRPVPCRRSRCPPFRRSAGLQPCPHRVWPAASEPMVPARRPLPGFQPARTTSWVR
jgi:hypothetical protein